MKTRLANRTPLFIFSVACFILLSPKWMFPVAAWLAPATLILLISSLKPWKSYLLAVLVLFLSSTIAQYKVMPFPGIFFFIMTLFISIQAAIPFWLHRVTYPRLTGWKKTLFFPAVFVAYEYLSSFGGGGTWGSISYTQFSNLLLIQTLSITGIWGITFLICWFNAILVWVIDEHWNWSDVKKTATSFGVIIVCLLFYGLIKTNPYFNSFKKTVRIAGITASNIESFRTMYSDAFGKTIDVQEETLSQGSLELAELNKGIILFVEDPFDKKFDKSRIKLTASLDSLLVRSQKEAEAGAKIISWSEALTFVIKSEEQSAITKGQAFARRNKVYFLMTIAAINPGKIEQGKKFIENKAILFNPSGQIESLFIKNRPVPVVEPSIAGDGHVPAIRTPYGKLAISICYDADFPELMHQMGEQSADILLLPSGDWREISPYHAQMAIGRAIENGVSLLRPVSGAESIATDYHGRIISTMNYFDNGERVLVAQVPVSGIQTVYAVIGDCFAWVSIIGCVVLALMAWRRKNVIVVAVN